MRLDVPKGLAFDGAGNLYIADRGNHRVRKVDALTGIITTVANLGYPHDLAFDGSGNLYIAGQFEHCVWKIDALTGIITTVAGMCAERVSPHGSFGGDGGPATQAQLYQPGGLAFDGAGNLYIADWGNHRVRKVDALTGIITTVAGLPMGDGPDYPYGSFSGDGGPATQAQLAWPCGLAIDGAGNLYISNGRHPADSRIHRVRKVAGIAVGVGGAVSEDIRELIDAGADLAAQDERGLAVLHWAGIEGRPGDIRALVNAGADVNAASRYGRLTALHFAVWRRAGLETVTALIAAEANVNATDMRGWTALHWAARDRRVDPAVVEALIAAGVDVNAMDNINQTALGYATQADIGNEAVAALLRAAGGF